MGDSKFSSQDEQVPASELPPAADARTVTGSILVVDDTPDNLRLLVRLLSEQGYKVRVATDGPHAIEAAQANPPDLILLDVMMMGMDGYEVCRRLKDDAQTREVPIIFLSALDQTRDKVKAFTSGGVDYITKPFQVAEVLARVKTHLALQMAQKHLEEKTNQLERVNTELAREIAERKLEILAREQAQAALLQAHDELEARVNARTAELSTANSALRAEIAERKRVEAALRENETRYHTLFENANDAIFILHRDRLSECNTKTLEMFGCTREQIVGQTLDQFSPATQPDGGNSKEKMLDKIARVLQGEPQQFEWQLLRCDGLPFSAEVSLNRIELSKQLFVQAIVHDITERKKAEQQIQQLNVDLLSAYDATLEGWAHALDLRDRETEGHSQRVTEMTIRLARAMGMDEAELIHVKRGALLHDIGKMGLPDHILFKPGKLNEEEWCTMRLHPVFAYEMLSKIAFLKPALDIPYCHHEKWDGTGYPRGLRGEQIPLAARLFAVADVWDALRSDRIYRKAWTVTQAEAYIRVEAGSHFDPQVVPIFLNSVLKEA